MSHPGVVVPGWLIVPVLILGVLVGAALGWWMRQRTLAGATVPGLAAGGRAPSVPTAGSEPEQPGPPTDTTSKEVARFPAVVVAPEKPARTATEEPARVAGPAAKPPPVVVEQLDLQPLPEREQPPDVEAAPAAAPDLEPAPETSAPIDQPAAPAGEPAEGERLGARMDDVLSELERRYRGRRVGPDETPGEPTPASRRRRPRPRR